MEDRHRELHENRSVHRRGPGPVGRERLPRSPYPDAQLRIEGRPGRTNAPIGLLRTQPCGGIVGTARQGLGGHDPPGHRKRITDALRQPHVERSVGAAQDVEVVQGHFVTLFGAHERIFGLAQPGVDHQHVALGDIPLGETAVHDLFERTDDRNVLAHGRGIELHGREVPIGIVGGITHVEARELLVAQGDVVAQFGLPDRSPHRTASVNGLDHLRQYAEGPRLDAFVTVEGLGETPVHRQPRKVARTGLPQRFGRSVALRGGDLQLPAVIGDRRPVAVERGLSERRQGEAQKEYRNCVFHGLRML